jgi:hypothetical protein
MPTRGISSAARERRNGMPEAQSAASVAIERRRFMD